ncbi:hypothetical protein SXCC_01514 [Gluconacetobacter sp. SXCC-1]|nr:hypothetical protein SXCC_01514 [Gluconacetobacter sp. SXCC-1]
MGQSCSWRACGGRRSSGTPNSLFDGHIKLQDTAFSKGGIARGFLQEAVPRTLS